MFVIIKLNPGLRKTALAELSGLSARTVKRTGKGENTVPDKCSVTAKDTVNVTVNDTVNVTVNSGCDRLFLLIRAQPGKRAEYYAKQLGRTRRSVMRYLSVLSGKIEFRGAPKTGGYYCKE